MPLHISVLTAMIMTAPFVAKSGIIFSTFRRNFVPNSLGRHTVTKIHDVALQNTANSVHCLLRTEQQVS